MFLKFVRILFIAVVSINFIFSNKSEQNIITVIGTTNVNGHIDPCGWKKKPMGGLARKATIIDELKESNIMPVIVDAGNLFFKKDVIEPGISTETAKINAEIILKSFNKMGCDAFSPGSKDFAAGFDYLLKLEKKAKNYQ